MPTTAPKKWSVLILSRYAKLGASSRLRAFQYIPTLEAMGATVTIAPFFDDDYLRNLYSSGGRRAGDVLRAYARRLRALVALRGISVAWVEKEIFPFLPGFFESVLSRLSVPYIVDYDDAIFHTYDLSSKWLVRRLFANKLDPLLRGAYAVTAGSAYLESYARARGAAEVIRLPTVVDLTRYALRPEPPRDEIRVGWIGSFSTTKYLELVREPLKRIAQDCRIRLVTVGANPIAEFGVPVEQLPWSEETEAQLISTMHVGIMPLPDEPWERGKCGYKLIQYMAAGRPVVASPVGVNSDIVTPDTGFLASTSDEWVTALARLATDAALCKQFGAAGRERVAASYSMQVTAPKMGALLSRAAGN